jgi:hydrogenase nickel incorporation protein HypA/HybF
LHELSLAEGIIQAVSEVADERGGKVKSFKVRVGELAQFDIRLIRELLAELKVGTELEGATVVVQPEGCKVRCKSCNSEWQFADLAGSLQDEGREMVHFLPELLSSYFRCPSCSKSYFEILEGRSVRVEEVVLDV